MSELKVNVISEVTGANGVVVDSVKLKDGGIVIADAGNIGSTSDVDAIAIGSDGDITLTQDLELQHDGAILSFGANDEVSLTHVHDTGLLLNSTNVIQFNDASQNIGAPSATVLDINATDEIELNATLVDINANVEISGTATTTGVHTFTAIPVLPANTIDSDMYVDGSIDTAHIADAQITKAKLADQVDVFSGTSLNAADLGSGIHIKTADSGASVLSDTDEFVIEAGDANTGMSFLSTGGNYQQISFGDDGDNDIGKIRYEHGSNRLEFHTNAAEGLRIDSAGHVTKPLQPAVHAVPNAAQNDMATGIVTIVLGAEVYDTNSDFNVSNSTFTAPVTGKYLVACSVDISDIDTATQWMYGNLLVSSNRNYYFNTTDPRKDYSADISKSFAASAIVDMDANDTLLLKIRSSSHGAAQMNVVYGGGETFLTIALLH